ncbi:MAG TPA: response regulator [Thermoplasmata archaeon]|nr:MAG TPA: response regulator [Thermoplasmata archaeon]
MQKKIMIVDDDPDILITIRELFETDGFEVYTVPCGKDCIEELENGFKGVILMDIMMPHLDGWSTIRQIVSKGLDKGNIISMISAKDECDWRYEDLKQYVRNYINKPFDTKELLHIIRGYFTTQK